MSVNEETFRQVDEYIGDLLANEDNILQGILANNKAAGLEPIHISPIQGKLLQVLARTCGAKRILELGTHGGYSTVWLARAMSEEGQLITIEADAENAELAENNIAFAGVADKVSVRQGKALDVLQALAAENLPPFDMVFIDADKPPYKEYFELAVKLSRPGAIIVADNVIREGKVLDINSTDEKVKGVQRLNKMLQSYEKVTAIILPTLGVKEYDGMVVAVVN